ncbi:uncharacterized protein LOC110983729 [Acanthaster planci]|uniref:Uncharacterized protein LOC110983729 n=1 Tax=Acanthaster planci TaxID=133434 RepID=A0A8B7Z6G6_ACAPL|nr:uncharacterized protein LOC110983729 [Acanthaster planci]XP_022098931.1 uncharacterized protein LOC110983729 [Acanthaster planci]
MRFGETSFLSNISDMGEVTEKRQKSERPLAPLIRAPKVTTTLPHPLAKATSSVDGTSKLGQLKRREKLRTVLAMMGRSSKKTTRLRNRDGEPKTDKSTPRSLLAEHVQGSLDEDGLQLMRSPHRRGAIADGRLPIKSPRLDTEKNNSRPEPPIRLRKFGKLHTMAKIILLLLRMCRTYILTENDAKMVKLFSAIDAAQAGDKYKIRGDLLFDVTMFRAKKQNKISSETKRVLKTSPPVRTEKDVHHVQVELQQMEFITKYPVHMQRSLIRAGAFESYETGRVIIRHGRRPYAFYLVLGGSALLLEGDPQNSGRPAAALLKGHVFGHEAIINRGRHNVTVISKEYIELLSLTAEEYSRIFLAGGVSNISGIDGSCFIESVSIFKGWPLHLLKKHPKKCRFNFFTRGIVIEQDSSRSDWIYIIKSGSCAVLKKLHYGEPLSAKRKRNLPAISLRRGASLSLSHEEQLANRLRDMQKKRAKALKGKSRRLKDTRPTNIVRIPMMEDSLSTDLLGHELSTLDQKPSLPNVNQCDILPAIVISHSSRPASSSSQVLYDSMEHGPESPHSPADGEIKPVFSGFSRGPFLTHTKHLPKISEGGQSGETPHHETDSITDLEKNRAPSSHSSDSVQSYSHLETQAHPNPSYQLDDGLTNDEQFAKTTNIGRDTFVQIDVLESGAIFGVSDLVFGKQPGLCLVSNGAECIMVAKKFYAKHATEANLKAITDHLRPYPTEDTLLRDLREKLTWQDHRTKTLSDTAHNLRRQRRESLAGVGLPRPQAAISMNIGP